MNKPSKDIKKNHKAVKGAAVKITDLITDCWKCDGSGHIHAFAHIDNGRCFACGGAGKVNYTTSNFKSDLYLDFAAIGSDEEVQVWVDDKDCWHFNKEEGKHMAGLYISKPAQYMVRASLCYAYKGGVNVVAHWHHFYRTEKWGKAVELCKKIEAAKLTPDHLEGSKHWDRKW